MSFHRLSTFVVILACLVYYFCIHKSSQEVNVESALGTLKGYKAYSRDGREYNSFTSIRYGKAPVGKLRFQPPLPAEKWKGVYDATAASPACFQYDPIWRKVLGQEDCLFLNVYTPKIPKGKEESLPTIVFIHGGYFMFGAVDLHNPDYFMGEDVVLVTLHYRLGALGFLSTNDDVVPGNNGLKDQLLALKWVQKNIRYFGGDPNLVTLMGESAGGASAHYHMFSKASKGLFHRTISQSGHSLSPLFFDSTRDTKAQAVELGKKMKCTSQSSADLVECLRSKDAWELTATQSGFPDLFADRNDVYLPTIENSVDKSNAIITTHTRELYEKGEITTNVPYLLGVNAEEGCWISIPILTHEDSNERLHREWNTLAPRILSYRENNAISQAMRKFYFGQSDKLFTFKDNYYNLTNLASDRYFLAPAGETIRLHAKLAPTYLYYLSRTNPEGLGLISSFMHGKLPTVVQLPLAIIKLELSKLFNWHIQDYCSCHADDLVYLFRTFPLTGITKTWNSHNYEFSKTMVRTWVHFAKHGYPGKVDGVEWTKTDPNKPPRYMNLGDSSAKMIEEPFTERLKFWLSLPVVPK